MRNHFLDALKLLFIVIISFWHTGWWSEFLHSGYLPVEFFFIISGYFIYRTSNQYTKLKSFIAKKFARLYPTYISIFLLYVGLLLTSHSATENILASILRDSIMLQATGLFELLGISTFNLSPHSWYVSSFFYGGIFVYFINKLKPFRIYILTFVAVIFYVWILFISSKGLNGYWEYESIFYIPLWRGIAGMSIGSLVGMATDLKLVSKYLQNNISIFNQITVFALCASIVCCFIELNFNWIGILCFIVVSANILVNNGISKWFNQFKYAQFIPDISLEILLIHKYTLAVTAKIFVFVGMTEYTIFESIFFIMMTISAALLFQKFIVPIFIRTLKALFLQLTLQV